MGRQAWGSTLTVRMGDNMDEGTIRTTGRLVWLLQPPIRA